MFAGFFIFCRNLKKGTHKPDQFFNGFQFAGNLFVSQLVITLLVVPLFFLAFGSILPIEQMFSLFTGQIDYNSFAEAFSEEVIGNLPMFMLSLLLIFCVSIYVSISFMFAAPLIVDAKLGFWDALETSRKTVGKQFFSFLFFSLVYIIAISIVTVLTCGLGLLFIVPFSYVLIFEMYDQIFEPEGEEILFP